MKSISPIVAMLLGSTIAVQQSMFDRPYDSFDPLSLREPDPRFYDSAPVVLGSSRHKQVHTPPPNPKADARKAAAVAEMRARKAAKRERSRG